MFELDRIGDVSSTAFHGVVWRWLQLSDSDEDSSEPEPVIASELLARADTFSAFV